MSGLSFREGSFQQPVLVKSEPGYLALAPGPASSSSKAGPSYLALAPPTTSQQPAILLYTTVAPHLQPTYNVTISSSSPVKKDTTRYPTSSVIVQPIQRKAAAVSKTEGSEVSAGERAR